MEAKRIRGKIGFKRLREKRLCFYFAMLLTANREAFKTQWQG